jgi:hypothetical protein
LLPHAASTAVIAANSNKRIHRLVATANLLELRRKYSRAGISLTCLSSFTKQLPYS